jgi:hypothetical protein
MTTPGEGEQRHRATTAGIADTIVESAQHLAELSVEMMRQARFMRRERYAVGLFAVLLIGLLAGLMTVAVQNRSNGAAIRSCTTPQGECYKRGQEQTGRAVMVIVACSRQPTQALAEKCVRDGLATR